MNDGRVLGRKAVYLCNSDIVEWIRRHVSAKPWSNTLVCFKTFLVILAFRKKMLPFFSALLNSQLVNVWAKSKHDTHCLLCLFQLRKWFLQGWKSFKRYTTCALCCCNQGVVMEIADYGLFFEGAPFNIEILNGHKMEGKAFRLILRCHI